MKVQNLISIVDNIKFSILLINHINQNFISFMSRVECSDNLHQINQILIILLQVTTAKSSK